jgi:hypothetical protein
MEKECLDFSPRIHGYLLLYLLSSIAPILLLVYSSKQDWYYNIKKEGWYPFYFTCMFFISNIFLFMVGIILRQYEIIFIWGLLGIFFFTVSMILLFVAYDPVLSFWFLGILCLFYLWLVYYISYYNILLSLLLVPLFATTMFIACSVYHLIRINNIPI